MAIDTHVLGVIVAAIFYLVFIVQGVSTFRHHPYHGYAPLLHKPSNTIVADNIYIDRQDCESIASLLPVYCLIAVYRQWTSTIL